SLLSKLVPLIIELMMDSADTLWGECLLSGGGLAPANGERKSGCYCFLYEVSTAAAVCWIASLNASCSLRDSFNQASGCDVFAWVRVSVPPPQAQLANLATMLSRTTSSSRSDVLMHCV